MTITARVRHRSWARRGSQGALSLLALGAGVACSGESGDVASSTQRESPPPAVMPSATPGSNATAGAMPVGQAPPSGTAPPAGTPPEAIPMPAGIGAGAPAESTPDALPLDEPTPSGGAPAEPAPACARELTDANKATVAAAIDQLFVRGDITAVDRFWAEPYVQHNPVAASGVTAFRNLFSGLINPGNSIYQLSRSVGECELVLIHGSYTSFGGPMFDLFRVRDGHLVEHWDAAATGAGPNDSGHTALDGDSVVGGVEQSGQNEALVLEFVDRVLINAGRAAIDQYVSASLIEHDAESSDGAQAYVQHLEDRRISYRQVRQSIGDGEFVFVLSEGAVDTAAVAHYDLFRVEASSIVEHWAGRRSVPAGAQSGPGIF